MKTVRRLFYVDIVTAVAFVAAAFLSLSFFIDFIDQLGDVGQNGYTVLQATLYSLLLLPGHFYEVAPIAVLIGTIYTLSRMAQSSEYTILRTGGLGPWRALSLLATLGLVFGVLTFVVGDYLAPLSERQASAGAGDVQGRHEARPLRRVAERQGPRRHRRRSAVTRSTSVRPARKALLQDIRIFEFDGDGRLLRRIGAGSAQVEAQPDLAH